MTNPPRPWRFDEWAHGPELAVSLRDLLGNPARGATVLAGSLIDDLLVQLVRRPRGTNGAAPDYAATCAEARAMGVISGKMLDELRTLGRIRNEFAHNSSHALDYDSPEIAGLIGRLRGPEQVAREHGVPGVGSGVHEALEKRVPLGVTGQRYWWAISVLATLAVLAIRLECAGHARTM